MHFIGLLLVAAALSVLLLLLRRMARERRLASWLHDKRVVVVGASSGIGEAIALECSRYRVRCVVLCARRIARLRALADRCRALGAASAIALECDVRSAAACETLCTVADGIDLLVLCAGIGQDFAFAEMQPRLAVAPLVETNFLGPVWLTHAALPCLSRAGGRVLAVASMSAVLPRPRRALYAATKAALVALFENLRTEGVPVTVGMPGFVNTELAAGVSRVGPDGNPVRRQLEEAPPPPKRRHGLPVMSAQDCAHVLLCAAANGDRRVVAPWWFGLLWTLHNTFPVLFERFVTRGHHQH